MDYTNAQNAGIFSQLAYAAEGSGVGSLSSEWIEDTELSRQIFAPDGSVESQFRVFVNSTTQQVVFAFKGMDNFEDFKSAISDSGAEAYLPLRLLANQALTGAESDYSGYQIVATGHSLGGGMAQSFALEHGLDGFGQNSLPIASTTLAEIYPGLDAQAINALVIDYRDNHTFIETNVAGDPATLIFSTLGNGLYLDASPTTLPSVYGPVAVVGTLFIGATGGPLSPAAVPVLAALWKAHVIETVNDLSSGYSLAPDGHLDVPTVAPQPTNPELGSLIDEAQDITVDEQGVLSVTMADGTTWTVEEATAPTDGDAIFVVSLEGEEIGTFGLFDTGDGSYVATFFDTSNEVANSVIVNADGSYRILIDEYGAVIAEDHAPDGTLLSTTWQNGESYGNEQFDSDGSTHSESHEGGAAFSVSDANADGSTHSEAHAADGSYSVLDNGADGGSVDFDLASDGTYDLKLTLADGLRHVESIDNASTWSTTSEADGDGRYLSIVNGQYANTSGGSEDASADRISSWSIYPDGRYTIEVETATETNWSWGVASDGSGSGGVSVEGLGGMAYLQMAYGYFDFSVGVGGAGVSESHGADGSIGVGMSAAQSYTTGINVDADGYARIDAFIFDAGGGHTTYSARFNESHDALNLSIQTYDASGYLIASEGEFNVQSADYSWVSVDGSSGSASLSVDGTAHNEILNADGTSWSADRGQDGSLSGSGQAPDGSSAEHVYDASTGEASVSMTLSDGSYVSWSRGADGGHEGELTLADGSYEIRDVDADGTFSVSRGYGNGDTEQEAFDVSTGEYSRSETYADGGNSTLLVETDGDRHYELHNDDGSYSTLEISSDGTTHSEFWDAGGELAFMEETLRFPDGSYSTHAEQADGAWETSTFDMTGWLMSYAWQRADGSHGSDAYDSDSSIASTAYDADGNYWIYEKEADGTAQIAYYTAAGEQTSESWWLVGDLYYGGEASGLDGSSYALSHALDGSWSAIVARADGSQIEFPIV